MGPWGHPLERQGWVGALLLTAPACCSLFGLEVKAEVVGRRVILDSRGWDHRSGTQGTVPATMWESQDE